MDSLFTAGMIAIPQGCRINKISFNGARTCDSGNTDIKLAPNVKVIQAFYCANKTWNELMPGTAYSIENSPGYYDISLRLLITNGDLVLRLFNQSSDIISVSMSYSIIYTYV